MKRNLYYLLLCALLLSACSGARYGHYGYVKKNDKVTTKQKHEKKKQVSLNKTEPIASNTELPIISDSIPSSFSVNREVNQVTEPTKNELIQTRKNVVKRQETKTILEPKRETDQKVDEKPRPNGTANTSLILSLAAIFTMLLGFAIPPFALLAVLVGTALGIAAFVTSIIALSEIKNKPDTYTNKGTAIFALVIGSLFILGGLLMLLYLFFFLIFFLAML
jgi:hypothetical protein